MCYSLGACHHLGSRCTRHVARNGPQEDAVELAGVCCSSSRQAAAGWQLLHPETAAGRWWGHEAGVSIPGHFVFPPLPCVQAGAGVCVCWRGASSPCPLLRTSSVFPVAACLFLLLLKFERERVLASVQVAFGC